MHLFCRIGRTISLNTTASSSETLPAEEAELTGASRKLCPCVISAPLSPVKVSNARHPMATPTPAKRTVCNRWYQWYQASVKNETATPLYLCQKRTSGSYPGSFDKNKPIKAVRAAVNAASSSSVLSERLKTKR